MKNVVSFITILLVSTSVWCQTPELVKDFNSGPEASFSEWNYDGISFNGALFLPIVSKELGEELAIVKDGTLRMLKDVNEGSKSSKPGGFKVYKDHLYFIADDGVHGSALWRTDGTESGTEMFFDPGSGTWDVKSLVTADNGWMYYSYRSDIFRTDGNVNEKVYSGASLDFNSKHASKTYSTYKEGIALINKNDDDSFSLISIQGKDAEELAKTDKTSFFAKAFGVAPLSVGLMFSIEGSNGHDAIYTYNEETKALGKLPIGGEIEPSRRTIDLNKDVNICWIGGKGYYSVTGKPGEEQLVISSTNASASQGDTIIYTRYEDKVVFFPITGIWLEDDFLVSTDGSIEGTRKISSVANRYVSGMVKSNNYAFMVEGVSNNFQPKIRVIDLETDEVKDLYTFTERSVNTNSVRPIGLLNGYLYFISNLDAEVGAELYRIQTNLKVSTEESTNPLVLELKQDGSSMVVESDLDHTISVQFFTASGQMVYQKNVVAHTPFTVDLLGGMYYVKLSAQEHTKTRLMYVK